MTTPKLDQYYPGGAAKQALDWNEGEHSKAVLGATGAGPHGPSGYMTIDNVIYNWGITDATNQGATTAFEKPYVDGPPNIVIASNSSNNATVVALTRSEVTIEGNGLVHWQAIGT